MFRALDNLFCELEGKKQPQKHTGLSGARSTPANTRNKKHSKTHEINSLGSALYHLYVAESVKDNGLSGWKDDKEKFKIELLNDLKTFLFGKWEKPWRPGLVFNDNGELIAGFRNIHGRVFKESGNVLGLYAKRGKSPFFITPQAIEKQKGTITDKTKRVGIISYIPIADEEDPERKKVKFMLPKYHWVVNVDYVDGIKKPNFKNIEFEPKELNEYAENFIAELVKRKRIPKLHYDQSDRACYKRSRLSWKNDSIHLPPINNFKDINYYYSTLFHEITHSTMNPNRCGRGKHELNYSVELPYANEELVAELGCMILCTELGLQYNRQNNLVYLKGWLQQAGSDSDKAMIEAYAYACDAVDYLMKDIDLKKLIPASMAERAKGNDIDPEPDKPRKTKTPAKAKAHSKAKGTKATIKRIPKGTNAQMEDETFVPYNYYEMQDELEQMGYKATVPASHKNVSVTGKGKRLFKGSKRGALAVKSELNAKGYAVRLHKKADGIYDISVVGKLKKDDSQPTDNQHTTKTTKTTFATTKKNIKAPKQDRLTNPIDIYIFKAGNVFRGIPAEQIKALLTAFTRLKKNRKEWAKYSETGELQDVEFTNDELEALDIDDNWEKEPATILITMRSRWHYVLSEMGEKIVNNYFNFKSVKGNTKPVNTGQLRLFGLQGINEVNEQFNEDLERLINNELPKKFVFNLGFPQSPLLESGLENLPVEMPASTLILKSNKDYKSQHPFKLKDVHDLPIKLNNPIAIFEAETEPSRTVVLTELKTHEGVNFICVLDLFEKKEYAKKRTVVNSIVSLYPKSSAPHIAKWFLGKECKEIGRDLLKWVDKEKALTWCSDHSSYVNAVKLPFKRITKIIRNFENGKKNTLGAIDTPQPVAEMPQLPQLPQMPQMPSVIEEKTEPAHRAIDVDLTAPMGEPDGELDGFNPADFGLTNINTFKPSTTYKLRGAIGEFLGEYDRKHYSIVLRGDKGAGKSRLLYQLMNAFADKVLKIAFLSLEMSADSSVSQRYKEEYITPENLKRIDTTEQPMSFDQLNHICKAYDVVCIDSWNKLRGMGQEDFDRLQKLNPKTIIIAIFQSTTGKVARGGNMPEYDAGVVIQVNKGGFAECEKNRYAPCDKIFSVFDKKMIAAEAMQEGV